MPQTAGHHGTWLAATRIGQFCLPRGQLFLMELWSPYNWHEKTWVTGVAISGVVGPYIPQVSISAFVLESFGNCVGLTLRLTGAASCRSGKVFGLFSAPTFRLTTIPTPDSCWILLIMFSWTPPQFAMTGSIFGAFLELNKRFVKQTPPTRYCRRFATR